MSKRSQEEERDWHHKMLLWLEPKPDLDLFIEKRDPLKATTNNFQEIFENIAVCLLEYKKKKYKSWNFQYSTMHQLEGLAMDLYHNDIRLEPHAEKTVYDTLEKIFQYESKNSGRVMWGDYNPLCYGFPIATDLCKKYPEVFEEFSYKERSLITKITPQDIKNRAYLSRRSRTHYYIGQAMGSRDDCPVAMKSKQDSVFYVIGCFHGYKNEVLTKIEETHGDNIHAQSYKQFVVEAENALRNDVIPSVAHQIKYTSLKK